MLSILDDPLAWRHVDSDNDTEEDKSLLRVRKIKISKLKTRFFLQMKSDTLNVGREKLVKTEFFLQLKSDTLSRRESLTDCIPMVCSCQALVSVGRETVAGDRTESPSVPSHQGRSSTGSRHRPVATATVLKNKQ